MKFYAIAVGFLATAACGGKSDPGGAAAPAATPAVALKAVDLTPCGEAFAGLTIQAPVGATVAESFGSCAIKAGDKFEIEIGTEPDLAGVKKEAQSNDVQKLKGFVVDSADLLLFETEAMGKSFFFVRAAPKAGDKAFRCDGTSMNQEQADAQLIATACKSLAKK